MQNTNGTPNGAQPRRGPTGQRTTSVNGANQATSLGNHHSATMRVTRPNEYNHQSHQAQAGFRGQHQMANIDGNSYEMAIRGSSGATMPIGQGYMQQLAQQAPQDRQYLSGQQTVNGNGFHPALPMFNNPAAMNALCQLGSVIAPQLGQQQQQPEPYQTQQYQSFQQPQQSPRQYQPPQYQTPQQYHSPQQQQQQSHQQYQIWGADSTASESSSDKNTSTVNSARVSQNHTPYLASYSTPSTSHHTSPRVENHAGSGSSPNAGSPLNNESPPDVGVAQSSQPLTNGETTEQFQTRVNALLEEKGTAYGGLIQNESEYRRYKQAVWKAKLKGGSYENRAQDYPKDQAGQLRVRKQLVDAFFNIGGEQDPATESGEFANCLAVKMVQGLSSIEVELLVHELMVSAATTNPCVKPTSANVIPKTDIHAQGPVWRACDYARL